MRELCSLSHSIWVTKLEVFGQPSYVQSAELASFGLNRRKSRIHLHLEKKGLNIRVGHLSATVPQMGKYSVSRFPQFLKILLRIGESYSVTHAALLSWVFSLFVLYPTRLFIERHHRLSTQKTAFLELTKLREVSRTEWFCVKRCRNSL